MTVRELAKNLCLTVHALPDGDREISGVYIGDLLSWVMGRADTDEAWITIMSNRNIVAVATLADTACILLAEGVVPDEGVAQRQRIRASTCCPVPPAPMSWLWN